MTSHDLDEKQASDAMNVTFNERVSDPLCFNMSSFDVRDRSLSRSADQHHMITTWSRVGESGVRCMFITLPILRFILMIT